MLPPTTHWKFMEATNFPDDQKGGGRRRLLRDCYGANR